ncbi:MAG: hypothetical protein WDN45_16275 [Caulobacteraceae bacterium]
MSEHPEHLHIARASGAGADIDQALSNAIAGLTDPRGHHPGLTFDAFEIVKITGAIDHPRGEHGKPAHIRVVIEATAHQSPLTRLAARKRA